MDSFYNLGMNKPKVIAVDARFYAEAGPGRYVKNIVQHLENIDRQNKYVIFMRSRGYDQYTPGNPNFQKVLADVPWYGWAEQTVFLAKILSFKPDLFYVPHFNVPVLYPGKLVTAIPDIIMHTFSTEKGTTLPKPYFMFKKFVYRLVLHYVLIRSKKIIVPTNDVLKDISSVYPAIALGKFVIANEGVDPDYAKNVVCDKSVLANYGITGNFLLYVSSMYEHKNVERLVDAFETLVNKYGYKGQLVLIGKKDKFSQRIVDRVRINKLENKIVFPGQTKYVTDEEVICLRKFADLYVFPSLKEGFSLTPLEAQSAGLACVISDIPCHHEVFGDSVMYFNPLSTEDMAAKIDGVLQNSRTREMLIQKGYECVKKYSWSETAHITLKVFNGILSR
jgi:glycosyltransferase involved in cell wall biosynthesis